MKELKVVLNTGNEGSSFETPTIKGAIKGVVLQNEGKVDIQITSKLGYRIYKELQHTGIHYFPLKTIPITKDSQKANRSFEDFYLNESLIIEVAGFKNTEVTIIIRYIDFNGEDLNLQNSKPEIF